MRNIATLESDTQATITRVKAEIGGIRQRAADEGREETAAERATIDTLLRDAEGAKATLARHRSDDAIGERIRALVPVDGVPGGSTMLPGSGPVASIGTQFTRHFAAWRGATQNTRGQRWESSSIDVPYAALFAATLTEDPASGGKLVVPDYRPGILPTLYRPLVVADLFAPGTTESNLITYMVEKTYINAADTVSEAAAKPESTLTFDAASDPVRKIAHWLLVTEEMLDDVPQLKSYLDSRLRIGVQLTEEDQLINGTTVAPDIIGIRNRTGLAPAIPKGTDSIADCLAKQIAAIQGVTGLAPDGIVMSPTDWLAAALAKTSTGEYLGDGPFGRPVAPTLWGLPVAVTTVMPAGVALVGCFKTAAQIFRKGGIRVDASNSHQDFFVKNLVAIRAELREALAVYRPACFGECTGLNV